MKNELDTKADGKQNMCVLTGPLIAVVKNHSAPLDTVAMANGKGNEQLSVVAKEMNNSPW